MNLLKSLTTALLFTVAATAQAVKLENFTINGIPVSEAVAGKPGVAITGATKDGSGNLVITVAGKLTYENSDLPKAYVKTYYRDPVDTNRLVSYGGLPGMFVLDAKPCIFNRTPSGQYRSEMDATVSADQASRCFPLFTPAPGKLDTNIFSVSYGHVVDYDSAYGVLLNLMPDKNGNFTRQVTVSPAQAASGFTLTYQLPDVLYGYGDVSTVVKKTYTITSIRAGQPMAFAAVDGGSPITAKTLTATVTPDTDDQGKQGVLFLAAVVPKLGMYLNNGKGWVRYNGGTLPVYQTVTLGGNHAVEVLPKATDVSSIPGTQVYVGYGLDEADAITNKKYDKVVEF